MAMTTVPGTSLVSSSVLLSVITGSKMIMRPHHNHSNDKSLADSLARTHAENYLYKLLCFKLSSFITEIEWIEELKQRMVQSKANVCALPYSGC